MVAEILKLKTSDVAGRYGVIEVPSTGEWKLQRRWFPTVASRFEGWCDRRWRRLPAGCVRLYYNQPWAAPEYLVLAYAKAGPRTSLASLRTGLSVLEEVAKLKGLQGIVCQATHPKLTERVMGHFGYVRHALRLKGHHYIKRLDIQPNAFRRG